MWTCTSVLGCGKLVRLSLPAKLNSSEQGKEPTLSNLGLCFNLKGLYFSF
jgi:hypothetical protein